MVRWGSWWVESGWRVNARLTGRIRLFDENCWAKNGRAYLPMRNTAAEAGSRRICTATFMKISAQGKRARRALSR
jgi:hypothetical protein